MAWYYNKYRCDRCHYIWTDEWSCACDDDCPRCGARHMQPYDYEDLSVVVEALSDGQFAVSWSPQYAEDTPCYVESPAVATAEQAEKLARLARNVVWPNDSGQPNGWLSDVADRVIGLGKSDFDLVDVYGFEGDLQKLYPRNRHVREKIRQQLQILRDLGALEFVGDGRYKLAA